MYRNDISIVRGGLRERPERYLPGEQGIVARLRHFREELEEGMAPEPWTALEASAVTLLADVCEALRLSASDTAVVLGRDGEQSQDAMLLELVRPRPLSERQRYVLAEVDRCGHITNGDLQRVFPNLSAETLRLDLVDLVRQGSIATTRSLSGDSLYGGTRRRGISVLTRENRLLWSEKMTKRAVVYARVSTDDQADRGFSLKLAADMPKRMGWK